MAQVARKLISSQEYLKFENALLTKHELYHGRISAMAGLSPEHGEMFLRISTLLECASMAQLQSILP